MVKITYFFKATSFKNDFYEKLFEIAFFFRDFFKILVSKKNYNKMMKYLELLSKINYSNGFFIRNFP